MPIYTHPEFKKLLKDPVVAEAFLLNFHDYYSNLKPLRDKVFMQTFDSDTIASLLSQREVDLIFSLMHELPASQLQDQKDLLLSLWAERSLTVKGYLAEVLAQTAPEETALLFSESLKAVFPLDDANVVAVCRLLEGAALLRTEVAQPILRNFYEQAVSPDRLPGRCLNVFVECAWKHALYPLVSELVASEVNRQDAKEPLFRLFECCYKAIRGPVCWYYFCADILWGETFSSFLQLPKELLTDASLLEPLDDLICWNWDEEADNFAETDLGPLWEKAIQSIKTIWLPLLDSAEQEFVSFLMEKIQPDEKYERIHVLMCFFCALCANHLVKAVVSPDISTESLIRDYVGQDIITPPYLESVIAVLKLKDHGEVVETMRAFLKRNHGELSEAMKMNMGRIIGRLDCFEFTKTLVGWINEEAGDELCEELKDNLLILKGADVYAMTHWGKLDSTGQIYLNDLILYSENAVAVKSFLIRWQNDVAVSDWAFWALMHADRDYLPILRSMLFRYENSVEYAFYVLSLLFNEPSELLEEIRAGLVGQGRVVDRRIKDAAYAEELKCPLDKIDLFLECDRCCEVSEYQVSEILMTDRDEFIIPDPYDCKRCGLFSEMNVVPRSEDQIRWALRHVSVNNRENNLVYRSSPAKASDMPKIGRNDPCHCGSGKKFKKCCLH